jgi:hypothetical protein
MQVTAAAHQIAQPFQHLLWRADRAGHQARLG